MWLLSSVVRHVKASQAYVVTIFSAVWGMCVGFKLIVYLPVKDPCSEYCWEGEKKGGRREGVGKDCRGLSWRVWEAK